MSLYPIATIATINIANDSAFHRLLFSNMIANMPNVALKPYNINVTKEKEEFLWKLIGQLFQSSYLYYLL